MYSQEEGNRVRNDNLTFPSRSWRERRRGRDELVRGIKMKPTRVVNPPAVSTAHSVANRRLNKRRSRSWDRTVSREVKSVNHLRVKIEMRTIHKIFKAKNRFVNNINGKKYCKKKSMAGKYAFTLHKGPQKSSPIFLKIWVI